MPVKLINKTIIVFDIGNTNITLGIFQGSKIISQARLASDSSRTSDEYEIQIKQILARDSLSEFSNLQVVIGSVVPSLTATFDQLTQRLFNVTAIKVDHSNCGNLKLNVPNPSSVGADRIANAVAAGNIYSKPCVVVDFGTATTFDVINSAGEYIGGIIAPGPETSLSALVQRTAKLQKIDLIWPKFVLGTTTESAMQSGLVIGYMSLIDGLIERLKSELGELGKVVATGGLGGLFVKHSKYMTIYDPELTLIGLKTIAENSNDR